MSADPDKDTACPKADRVVGTGLADGDSYEVTDQKWKPHRSVRFPEDNQLVTQYFEPANPWHDVPTTTRAHLAADYLESCRRHNTTPIDSVLQQIRELPENAIGGGVRAARLVLADCSLTGSAAADALEALLRKVQFRRLELQHAEIDDEGAEAIFDMIEYYESASVVNISGPRQFGIRGWQAACRMIKKSAELTELEICESEVCASHAPVLVRALRPHTCTLRALCLQRAALQGEPLLCLVIALKSNSSIRELRLPDNQLMPSDAQQLGSLLRFNLNIQLLDLSNNQIQDTGTGYIADALVEQAAQTPPSAATSPLSPHHYPLGYESRVGLAFLVLWNNQLTRNCAPHLSKALRSSQSLCVLNIGRNALGSECIHSLQDIGSVVSLGLQCARLNADSAASLARLLRPNTKLQRLDLRDNRLGVVGLQAILNAMKENTTVTQIDLDDPVESTTLSAEDGEAAIIARLTRDIVTICRRNEPPATEPERRVHRKISLTCHTACVVKQPTSSSASSRTRASRLRSPAPSPAPSPAGSPVPPSHHHSRFSVTRVTPERESSTESSSPSTPTRPGYCLTPSRFKVVQVAEPPQIQVHPAQKRSSRFSVTRNYDSIYNPSPRGSPSASPSPSISPVPSAVSVSPSEISRSPSEISVSSENTVSPTRFSVSPSEVIFSPSEVSVSPTRFSVSPSVINVTPKAVESNRFSVTPSEGVSCLAASDFNAASSRFSVSPSNVRISTEDSVSLDKVIDTKIGTASAINFANATPIKVAENNEETEVSKALKRIEDDSMSAQSAATKVVVTHLKEMPSSSMPIEIVSQIQRPPTISTYSIPTAVLSKKEQSTKSMAELTTDMQSAISSAVLKTLDCSISLATTPDISKNVVSTPALSDVAMPSLTMDISKPVNMATILTSNVSMPENLSKVVSTTSSTVIPSLAALTTQAISKLQTSATVQKPEISTVMATPLKSNFTYTVYEKSTVTKPCIITVTSNLTTVSQNPILTNASTISDNERMVSSIGRETNILPAVATVTTSINVPKMTALPFDENISHIGMKVGAICPTYYDPAQAIWINNVITAGPNSSNTEKSISECIISQEADFQSDHQITRSEPVKITDLAKNLTIEPSLIDTKHRITPSTININEQKVITIGKLSISPIPEDCSKSDVKPKDESKMEGIGIRSNVLNKTNTEADIFTKIAEITETVAPKVVEINQKDIAKITDLGKPTFGNVDTKTDVTSTRRINDSNDPILKIDTAAEVSSNIVREIQTIQQILPLDPNTELAQLIEQMSLNDKVIEDPKHVESKIHEMDKSTEFGDNTVLKYTLKEALAPDLKQELRRNEKDMIIDEEKRSDIASKLEEISRISETKIDDGKNKSYSDVLKSDPKYNDKSEQLTHKEEISDSVVKTEIKLVKSSIEVSEIDKVNVQIEVTVKKESAPKVHSGNKDFVIDDILVNKEDRTMKQIEAITEDLGNLIQEMRHISSTGRKNKSDCTVDLGSITNKVPGIINRDVVLKKNKSESSLDSPDLEVSRLMNKKLIGSPFCDSSSSLEISGSSMESLNIDHHAIQRPVIIQESVESDTELDRRKDVALSTESSMESTSEVTPVNSGNFLNMSVSSNESVSPIIFGKKKKIHDSLSSLEASMSSLDSGRQEKVMVTSADSGIEYSLQQPSENKDDNSSNEGTLTHNSSLRDTVKKDQETLTSSPKRTSSLLDVPALKTKGLDRMRKISWVAPSSSFHIPRVEAEKEKPSHLEKLLSLFQHPTSLFSRGSQSEEERKSASNTPPRKDSSLTSSFWSWGSTIDRDKEDKEDSSEATDSTLSERVQVSFVDESFSKKLDSKTPSTDTDNTLSEFQSFPAASNDGDVKVTDSTTDGNLVQKCLGLSLTDKAGSNGNARASDMTDLNKPNDMNRNYEASDNKNEGLCENKVTLDKEEAKEPIRPRSFAAVLKSSGSENSLDKQPSPDSGQSVGKLPSKIIRTIKENISPENTLTSSMTNTKTLALALELTERQVKNAKEVTNLEDIEPKADEVKIQSDLAPIATIEETCDEAADNTVNIKLEFIDNVKTDLAVANQSKVERKVASFDLGKDALSYLIYDSQDFDPSEQTLAEKVEGSLAQELKEAEIKELQDLSPELVIDEGIEVPDLTKEIIGMKSSPVIPERAKLKKANSFEDLSQREEEEKSPKTKTIAFKLPETSPRDIPERRPKLRTMSGSSPKSLPDSLNKPSPLTKIETVLKKRKKVSSLGKIARDSLLALNMSDDEIAEHRRSYVTSVESLRSLESVSEDANSQSGTSVDSRCRSCLRTSQESLMSLDSITEDCKCGNECEKARSVR